MKRILSIRLTLSMCGLSVFFTGCNQDKVQTYVDLPSYSAVSVATAGMATEETRETMAPLDLDESLRDETEQMALARFEDLTGPRAFYFPENHSDRSEDMRAFEILGLEDDYFYYYYVTKDTKTGNEVRAVARNHKNGSGHKVLYERQVKRDKDQRDDVYSFYVHMCASSGGEYRISIYEEGNLSIIDKDGNVKFSRSSGEIRFGNGTRTGGENLQGLIDRIFQVGGENPAYFDKDVTSVVSDGRYNFYIPVTLTKEDYTKMEDEDEDVETDTYILYYSYLPVAEDGKSEYLLRYNTNYDNQVKYWKDLAKDSKKKRDPEADWAATKKKYPDKWGSYQVASGKNIKNLKILGQLYQWKAKDQRRFERNLVVSFPGLTTTAVKEDIKSVDTLKKGQSLDGYFFQDGESGYCPLLGALQTGDGAYMNQKATRKYTITVGEGDEAEEETIEESLDVRYAHKQYFAEGTSIERFFVDTNNGEWYMTPGPITEGRYFVGSCSGDKCLLNQYITGEDSAKVLRWIIFSGAGDDIGVYILNELSQQPYVLGADLEHQRLLINAPNGKWITLMTSDLNPSGYRADEQDKQLTEGMKKQAQANKTYDASGADLHGNPDRYDQDNVLILGDSGNLSVLFTSFYNGIQLFEGPINNNSYSDKSSSGKLYRLSEAPMYRAWRTGENQILAVGFERTDVTYEYMDIARARIYTFDLKELKQNADARQIPEGSEVSPGQSGSSGGSGSGNKEDSGGKDSSKVPDIPPNMDSYWEDARKDRESKPKPTGTETLPSVDIYDMDDSFKDAWKEKQETESEK